MSGKTAYVDGEKVTGSLVVPTIGDLTSDATATAGDLLSGKTAYSNGSKVTGTIPLVGAQTYTPSASDQTITAGSYLSGTQTVKGDANLISGNIKSGVSIFGVNGSLDERLPGLTLIGRMTNTVAMAVSNSKLNPYGQANFASATDGIAVTQLFNKGEMAVCADAIGCGVFYGTNINVVGAIGGTVPIGSVWEVYQIST